MTTQHSRPQSLASLALTWMLLALALAVTGCPRRDGTLPLNDARQMERLRRTSASDLQCDRTQMTLIPLNPTAIETRGCGRIREYSLVCTTRSRCGWQPIVAAAVLAQTELSCPLEAMSVAAPSPTTREVSGCGRANRYELLCDASLPCRWTRTATAVLADAPAPPSSYNVSYEQPGVSTPQAIETQPTAPTEPAPSTQP